VTSIDLNTAGVGIVVVLITVWVATLAVARLRRRRHPDDAGTEEPAMSARARTAVGIPSR
jgi:hypothetical protein